MTEIILDESCIDKVISETPFVKLLSIPKYNEQEKRYECLAQVNSYLAYIEVSLKPITQ